MTKAKILGKLKGVIASAKEPSRNGRKYTEAFWDSLFNRDLFKEGIDNKMFLGELYHPDDSEEYSQIHCDDRAAVVLTDVVKKGLEYIGTFEILPTKAGQCLRNLLDIGCIFGISSRGLADQDSAVFDENIASTYDLITWDVVAFPGIKSCRLHEVSPVAESVRYKNKVKAMESLTNLSNLGYGDYINEILKEKEEYDNNPLNKYDITDDLKEVAKIVQIDENGDCFFDDGIHGKHNVVAEDIEEEGDYIVDDIVWDVLNEVYYAIGDWLKI